MERKMIAICAALGWELSPLLRVFGPTRRLRGRRPATWESRAHPGVLIFQTGVGIAPAERATASILDGFPVTAVINSGSAGALVPGMEAGSVVVATAVLRRIAPAGSDPGFSREPTENQLAERLAEAARRCGLEPWRGEILSSPLPLATSSAKWSARQEVAAIAVEMEGAGVAAASRERGVPFASVRIILDRQDQDLELPAGERTATLRTLAEVTRLDAIARLAALRVAMRRAQSAMEALFTSVRTAAGSGGWFDDGS